jgi:hypothetical protein
LGVYVLKFSRRQNSVEVYVIALMMDVELVSESSDFVNLLTRLSAQDNFINLGFDIHTAASTKIQVFGM